MDSQASSTLTPAADQGAPPTTTQLRSFSVPAIGTLWVEQGGIFAGIVRAPEGDCALIISEPAGPGHLEDRVWGGWDKKLEGTDSRIDGRANTQAMAAADCELAKDILALDHAGFNDWYLAAQGEMQIANANVPDLFDEHDLYWTSTQYSPRYAWVQYFGDGHSYVDFKHNEFRAVAVRRFVL